MKFKTIGDLHLHEDLAHERLEWKLQRIGWVVILLLLIAALLGLFAHGPLSDTMTVAGDVRVAHHRWERYEAPTRYDITVAPSQVGDGRLRVRLGAGFVERVDVERIEPEPLATRADGDALVHVFAVEPGRQTRLRIHFRPRRFGTLPVRMRVQGQPVAFTQFVYP